MSLNKKTVDFMNNFEKEISKMDGVSFKDEPPRYWFGFGSYAINRVMSGSFLRGIPQGRITALCGPSSAGKSFLAANLIRQAQAEGAMILAVDAENALDKNFVGNVGVDVSSGYKRMKLSTIKQATKAVSDFIDGYKANFGTGTDIPKVLIVVDSLDYLMTEAEATAAEKGEVQFDQGQQTRMLKSMLRTWVHDISDLNISIVVTKQVYRARQDQLLQGEGAWVINDAIRYACSQIVLATRLKLKDDDSKAPTGKITGIRLKAEGFKTRFCEPFSSITVEVPYTTGMNAYSGMFDIAVALGIIIKKGSWYNIKGSDQNYRSAEIEGSDELMNMVVQACEVETQRLADSKTASALVVELEGFVEDTTNEPVKRNKS